MNHLHRPKALMNMGPRLHRLAQLWVFWEMTFRRGWCLLPTLFRSSADVVLSLVLWVLSGCSWLNHALVATARRLLFVFALSCARRRHSFGGMRTAATCSRGAVVSLGSHAERRSFLESRCDDDDLMH